MLVHKLSQQISLHLARSIGWHDRTELLTYGFELIIGESLKFAAMLLLSAYLGLLVPTLLIIFTAVPLRLLTGGGHCTTYFRCLVLTVTVYLLLSATTFHISAILNNEAVFILLAITMGLGLFAIQLWVPGNNPSRVFTTPEKARFKKLSRLFLALWSALSLLLLILPAAAHYFKIYIICTSVGILWQVFLISPLGYQFFRATEKFFDLFNTKEVS